MVVALHEFRRIKAQHRAALTKSIARVMLGPSVMVFDAKATRWDTAGADLLIPPPNGFEITSSARGVYENDGSGMDPPALGSNDMAEIILPLGSLNRFVIRHFFIDPTLVGATHEFTYEKSMVRIQLPSGKDLPTEPLEGELLSFYAYREVGDKKLPSNIRVHAVDVETFTGDQVTVPLVIIHDSVPR